MSADIINTGSEKDGKHRDDLIKKVFIITQAITLLIASLSVYIIGPDVLKYIVLLDIILSALFVIDLWALLNSIKLKLISTGGLYTIVLATFYVLVFILYGEFIESSEIEDNLIFYIIGVLAAIITFITIIFILDRLKHVKYLKDISLIIFVAITFKLVDHLPLQDDLKLLIKLLLGIFFIAALICLILEFLEVPFSAFIATLTANSAAMAFAGILQLVLWKNESTIQSAFGLEPYQANILLIAIIPLSICLELAIEILLKKVYKSISKKWRLSENYKVVIYLLMLYITALFMIMTGLAKEDPELYVAGIFSKPAIAVALIILAIVLKSIEIRLRTHIDVIAKGSSNSARPNEDLTYTITVTNKGPYLVEDVQVIDKVPADTTYVSSYTIKGTYDEATGIWSVGDLAKGESASFSLVVIAGIPPSMTITNAVEVSSRKLAFLGKTKQLNITTQVIDVADLEIIAEGSPELAQPGDNITYAIKIRNNGPCPARDVQFTDKLPDEVTYISSSTTRGEYNNSTGVWPVGDLAKDESVSLELKVIANTSPSEVVMNAGDISSLSIDPNLDNNHFKIETYIKPKPIEPKITEPKPIEPKPIETRHKPHRQSLPTPWKQGLVAIFVILAIFAIIHFIPLHTGDDDTNTNISPESDNGVIAPPPENNAYAIKINYSGSWMASVGEGTDGSNEFETGITVGVGKDRSHIYGTGNMTVPIKLKRSPITIDIQKTDDSYDILAVEILKGSKKLEAGNTSSAYGKFRLTAML